MPVVTSEDTEDLGGHFEMNHSAPAWVRPGPDTHRLPHHRRISVFSYREQLPRGTYPQRLNIFWSMRVPDHNGLPSRAEAAHLETFENRLVTAVERDKTALLVAVVTGRSEREFVFHLQQPKQFMQRLTDMPQETERYPIEIHLEEDPDWLYFDDLAPIDP